jgi:hypothetical protein
VTWVWLGWEWLYLRTHRIDSISVGSLLGFQKKGSVLELHFNNRELKRIQGAPDYSGFKVMRRLRAELTVLARRVGSGELGRVTGIRGTSLMGEAGPVLGFDVRALPKNIGTALQRYFLAGIDANYHPGGLRDRAIGRWPVEILMSVDTLLERYGEKSARSTIAR